MFSFLPGYRRRECRQAFLTRALVAAGLCIVLPTPGVTEDVVINQKFPISNPGTANSNLSPPHIDQTNECATKVRVDSFIPHATIRVYLKKATPPNQLIGGPYTSFYGFAGIPLTITLHTGDVLLATQTVNGVTSALSAPMVAGAMPSTLPEPDIDPPIYACGQIAGVDKLISGVNVEVQDSTASTIVGTDTTPNIYFSGNWDPVTVSSLDAPPKLSPAHEIRAKQSACLGPPASHFGPSKKVQDQPSPFEPPVVERPIIGNDTVTLDNLYAGAIDAITDGGSPDGGGLATSSSNWAGLNHKVTSASNIRATQKLCATSGPSKPVTPTTTIPPPELVAPICPGQEFVTVDNTTINATLVLLKNGVPPAIAYGGAAPGPVPLDLAPPNTLSKGEDVQVAEYLGSDVVLSNSVVVGCTSATVIDMVPISLSAETNQDSEVFLSVDNSNPELMVGSAFVPTSPGGTLAPIYLSQDGGNSWIMDFSVPVGPAAVVPVFGTDDITHAFAGQGNNFYAARLTGCNNLSNCGNFQTEFEELKSTNVAAENPLSEQASRFNEDQPFTRATTVGGSDRIYVGNNDWNFSGNTASIDVSPNGGSSYTTTQIDSRSPQSDGPSIRPTIAKDQTVYAAFFSWTNTSGPCTPACTVTADLVVVRDDSGGIGSNPFQALTDPNDGNVGNRVRQNLTIAWSNQKTLGQERTGSTLSLAVDPNNSSRVFIAWADSSSGSYTIHVLESTDRGKTWSTSDLFTASNALNVALAVANNGTVGMLYQQHAGAGSPTSGAFGGTWTTHLRQTNNSFKTTQNTVLARTPSGTPVENFLPYLGDYVNLMAVGNQFRGIFTANNTPAIANFPSGVVFQRVANFTTQTLETSTGTPVSISIDPFYFAVPVLK
jgi:hypothetical protein